MTREIRTESRGWFFTRDVDVIYEDGKEVGHVETETRGWLFPEEVKVHYNNEGDKVSITHKEDRGIISSQEVDVTYDTSGNKISETHAESRLLGGEVRATYDRRGNKISESHEEKRLFGGKVRVVKDLRPKNKSSSESNLYDADAYSESSSPHSRNNSALEKTLSSHNKPQINPSVNSVQSRQKSEKEILVERVLAMSDSEMDGVLHDYAHYHLNAEIRAEIILRQVTDKNNDVYGMMVISNIDSVWAPYAKRRLENLIKEKPVLANLLPINMNCSGHYLLMKDKDGSKALAEAEKIGRNKEEIKRIETLTDLNELLQISRERRGEYVGHCAEERYRTVHDEQLRQRRRPGYIIKQVFKALMKK